MLFRIENMLLIGLFIYSQLALPCIEPNDPQLTRDYRDVIASYQQLITQARIRISDNQKSIAMYQDIPSSSSRSESAMAAAMTRNIVSTLQSSISDLSEKISCYEKVINTLSTLDRYSSIIAEITWPTNPIVREGRIFEWRNYLAQKAQEVPQNLGLRRAFFVSAYQDLFNSLPARNLRYSDQVARYASLIEAQYIKKGFASAKELESLTEDWRKLIDFLANSNPHDVVEELKTLLANAVKAAQQRLK